jgi:tetratricopeptide (TPR) repeat protein
MEIDKLKKKIADLEKQLIDEREEFEWDFKAAKESSVTAIRKLESEISDIKKTTSENTLQEIHQLHSQREKTQKELLEKQQLLDQKNQQLQEKDDSLRAGQTKINELNQKIAHFENKLAESEERLRALQIQPAGSSPADSQEMEHLKQSLQEKEGSLKQSRAKVNELSNKNAHFESALAEAEELIEDLQKKLQKSEKQETKEQSPEENQDLKHAEVRIEELTKQADLFKSALADADQHIESLEKRTGEKTPGSQDLKQEIDKLNEELAMTQKAAGQRSEQQERQIERMKTELATLQEEIQATKSPSPVDKALENTSPEIHEDNQKKQDQSTTEQDPPTKPEAEKQEKPEASGNRPEPEPSPELPEQTEFGVIEQDLPEATSDLPPLPPVDPNQACKTSFDEQEAALDEESIAAEWIQTGSVLKPGSVQDQKEKKTGMLQWVVLASVIILTGGAVTIWQLLSPGEEQTTYQTKQQTPPEPTEPIQTASNPAREQATNQPPEAVKSPSPDSQEDTIESPDKADQDLQNARSKAHTLLNKKKYKQAEKHLRRWLKKAPDDVGLLFLHARSLFFQKKTRKAIRQMKKAIDKQPDFADAFYELGRMHLKTKMRRKAKKAWKQFLRLAPSGHRRIKWVKRRLRNL